MIVRRLVLASTAATLLAGCTTFVRVASGLPPYRADVDRIVVERVAMRDGARLTTRIFFPEGEGPWPVIVVRNPYDMWNIFDTVMKTFARYGYVVVHQDVRGRFGSEGEWLPLLNERRDGLDTLAWITTQPWQDGNIGLWGMSYLSAVQWAVAADLPPEVKTIVPMVIGTDLRNVVYEKGAFRHEIFTFWAALMPDHGMGLTNAIAYRKAVAHWPPGEVDEKFLGKRLPWYREWQRSPHASAPLWNLPDAELLDTVATRVDVPVLMMSGWYDIFIESQLNDWQRLATQKDSRLLVGPWTHILGISGDGVKDFDNAGHGGNLIRPIIHWFDHHLKGMPLDDWGPVRTYEIGENVWHDRPAWPPATTTVTLGFTRLRHAGGCDGGRIVAGPSELGKVSWSYDPRNPVPTRGGGPMLAFVLPGWTDAEPSNRDQRGLCERTDVVTFISAPLSRPLRLAGKAIVHLTVASSARDTAFTAKLIEVDSRGRALNVQDTITTLAFRNDSPEPLPYEPGSPVDVTLDMWPIEWTFQPGTRLRIDLSSSNWPAYHAHANRAGPWASQTAPVTARQTVYFGPDTATRLELPVRID